MIKEQYKILCNIPSDINEHLPTLLKYALRCNHITEFGVRNGVSTWAFLAANPEYLISYDFCWYDNIQNIIDAAYNENISFSFCREDVLDIDILPTDLLFIDTFHHPLQLKRELSKHSDKVKKYIILHDTETNKRINDQLWPDEICAMTRLGKNPLEYNNYPNTGIHIEIINFLYEHPDWMIKEVFSNNNGLTILEHALE